MIFSYRKRDCVNATLHGINASLNVMHLEKLLKSGDPHLPPSTNDDQINNFPEGKKYLGLNEFKLLINGSLVMNFSDGSQATYDKAKKIGSSYCLDFVTILCSDDLTWYVVTEYSNIRFY